MARHRDRILLVTLGLAALLAAPSAAAAPAEGASPPLYTNADLDSLDGEPAAVPAIPARSDDDWDAVHAFLERQYARIDAERAYRLSLREQAEDRRASRRERHDRSHGYPGFWQGPWRAHPRRAAPRAVPAKPPPRPDRIVPIHARPPLTHAQPPS